MRILYFGFGGWKVGYIIMRLGSKRKRLVILGVALLAGLAVKEAWDPGIITSFLLTMWLIVVAIWQMLSDFLAACWELWLYILHQRS